MIEPLYRADDTVDEPLREKGGCDFKNRRDKDQDQQDQNRALPMPKEKKHSPDRSSFVLESARVHFCSDRKDVEMSRAYRLVDGTKGFSHGEYSPTESFSTLGASSDAYTTYGPEKPL